MTDAPDTTAPSAADNRTPPAATTAPDAPPSNDAPPSTEITQRRPPATWCDDASSYAHESQFILVAIGLVPATLFIDGFLVALLIRYGVPTWLSLAIAGVPLLASLGWSVWTICRMLVIFLRADSRLRALGYRFGAAHHVLRIIESSDNAEVRLVCPPPRDELAVTPSWPREGSEYTRPARAMFTISHPFKRRPVGSVKRSLAPGARG